DLSLEILPLTQGPLEIGTSFPHDPVQIKSRMITLQMEEHKSCCDLYLITNSWFCWLTVMWSVFQTLGDHFKGQAVCVCQFAQCKALWGNPKLGSSDSSKLSVFTFRESLCVYFADNLS
ncbi:hypothetical protein ILYODFUR_022116, partial [Ilyodon furcidens]